MFSWAKHAATIGLKPTPPSSLIYARSSLRYASTHPHRLETPDYDYSAARDWYKNTYRPELLNKLGEFRYSRSSGPGGQNVNKVESKAQLRVPIDRLLAIVPEVMHKPLRASRYFAENSSSIVIQADDSRKRETNKDTCIRKLNDLIIDVYKQSVPGETSESQKQRVKDLQTRENEARLKSKKQHSSKKQSRASGGFD
ncbi:hypothetical protein PV10_00468 [Exophiala mesophila]|uniref:Prokaryotic-type class I peptide chain release factors domain-containing protein n=1 Tax=Exophiala mesophila TaxID=212818 RepID=A0A0D1ZRQ2_EXOME|nr:uncharacterized protein PV10_00468 [Exophiala mesophila]KIV96629.1 hypothetical protein PV10_00468 [Exophiala mesophila]